jgi:hypothetical protein
MKVLRYLEFGFGLLTFISSLVYPGLGIYYGMLEGEATREIEEALATFGLLCLLTLVFAVASCFHARCLSPWLWIPILLTGVAYIWLSGILLVVVVAYSGSGLAGIILGAPMVCTLITFVLALINQTAHLHERSSRMQP